MATNITNKAGQLRHMICENGKRGFEYGEVDVRRIVKKRWPDLLPDIQEQIVQAVMQ